MWVELVVLDVHKLVAQGLGGSHRARWPLLGVLESVAVGSGGLRLHGGGFEGVVRGSGYRRVQDVGAALRTMALLFQQVVDVIDSTDVARLGACVLLLLLLGVLLRVLVNKDGK